MIISYDPAEFELDQFRIAGYHTSDSSIAFNEGELPTERRATPFSSGRETALVLLSDDLVGQEITVRVWGLYAGQPVAFGRANIIPELGIMREVEVTLEVAPDCGDGAVHPTEETCDTGIDPGMEGACPETLADCEDTDVCTADRVEGAGTCLALCFNEPISECVHGDGCCPNGCGPATDSDCSAICGDGLVGTGETCDTGIPPGDPGGCPTTCEDDSNPCTDDSLTAGGSCQAACAHSFITQFFGGDGCCPPGGDATLDSDCEPVCGNGVLEPTESCDLAIPANDTGACPTDCTSGNACAIGTLFDANTCDARCVTELITLFVDGDNCCPAGGNSNIDSDCPIACGNGAVEPGETCDTGIPTGTPGACPTCDDGVPCTADTVVNPGSCIDSCTHTDITGCTNGDGCCPNSCGPSSDDDCTAVCGNNIFEPADGELCDTAITSGSGLCPVLADCDDVDACTIDSLIGGGSCQAQCLNDPVVCADNDSCCSPQCNANIDNDCTPVCGNSVVEPDGGEVCDTGIAPGSPGACPTACSDPEVCTDDVLVGGGTCAARCDFVPITAFDDNDGCCPAGGNANVDDDCLPICGNSVVEPGETCDTAIPFGDPGGCPVVADCDDGLGCTADALVNDGSCDAVCTNNDITSCVDSDGCCPAGCDLSSDNDCTSTCGDGAVTGTETCDTAISGSPGACPVQADCDDSDDCTTDTLVGGGTCQAHCDNDPVGCTSGDNCCPATGCNNNTDADCPAVCGNGVVEPLDGELCDTAIAAGSPGACPTAVDCDDNDPCTSDSLVGTGCGAYCDNVAITTCSLSTGDSCCPLGCDATTDADCGGCGNGIPEGAYGEECDDGDTDNTNACSNSCTVNNGAGGDTCQLDNDCIGQFYCLNQATYSDLLDGYCVDNATCDPLYPSVDCGPKGTCVPNIGTYIGAVCALRCTDLSDCRWADGQTCQFIGAGVSACLP